jgi:hypothetical protein
MIIRIGDGKIDECGVDEALIGEETIGEEETGEEKAGEGKSESRPETPGAEDAFAIRDERFADTKYFAPEWLRCGPVKDPEGPPLPGTIVA